MAWERAKIRCGPYCESFYLCYMLRCLMQYNIFSIPKRGLKTKFVLYVGFDRESRIFRLEVLGTKDIAIGPLEYL